ncbi:sigma-70 family RNA polymerase sigma factor [bacterium]|nr:sigma-70 family RNA polymerase sigma factor [bacterium]
MTAGTLKHGDDTVQPESRLDQLVALSKAGCDRSREELFTHLFHDLQEKIALCVGKGFGTPSRSVSDFAQNTWMRIASRFGEFKGDTYRSLCRWAMSTLSWEFLNARRRVARRRGFHRNVWQQILVPRQKDEDSCSLLDQTIREEDLTRAEICFQRLPIDDQLLFGLRFWEGLKFNEIASNLGVDERTVRRRYQSAIAQLRRWFDDGEQ